MHHQRPERFLHEQKLSKCFFMKQTRHADAKAYITNGQKAPNTCGKFALPSTPISD